MSTLKSPTKLEPKVALVPMPASLAPCSTASAITLGHSCHFLHLRAVGVAAREHVALVHPQLRPRGSRAMVSGGAYCLARSTPFWFSASAV